MRERLRKVLKEDFVVKDNRVNITYDSILREPLLSTIHRAHPMAKHYVFATAQDIIVEMLDHEIDKVSGVYELIDIREKIVQDLVDKKADDLFDWVIRFSYYMKEAREEEDFDENETPYLEQLKIAQARHIDLIFDNIYQNLIDAEEEEEE